MDKPAGSVQVAIVRGVPVFIHWSLPAGGLLISFISGVEPIESLYYCIAFATLIAIHEFGHFAAARARGLKVFSVEITGFGGQCKIQAPRGVRDTLLVFSAGLLMQLVLLFLTVLLLTLFGPPSGTFGKCAALTFTFYNVVLLVINLIPSNSSQGLSTDGRIIWQVVLHAVKGTPHPFPDAIATTHVFPPETSLLSIPGFSPPGFITGIEILNDSTTPMELVITVLMRHLQLDRDNAARSMLEIHTKGGALFACTSPGKAAAIATAITADTRKEGHQLVCRAVAARN